MHLIDVATLSRDLFFFFVEKCNDNYRSGHDLECYREVIAAYRERGLQEMLEDKAVLQKLYETLEQWDMNKRGARMVPFPRFADSVRFWKNSLLNLDKFKLHEDIETEFLSIFQILEKVFCNIKVMESKRRIVGVSKTLHFFLPDLIMPIDSKYTMDAFYGYNKFSNSPKGEFKTFKDIFERTYEIASRLNLSLEDADGILWKTSVPKLIDNAVIGLDKCSKEEAIDAIERLR
jgi:hypothetical protein